MEYKQWLDNMLKTVNVSTASTACTGPSISLDQMRKTVEELDYFNRVSHFVGMEVVVVPDSIEYIPRLQLSSRVCEVLSPEIVASTNAWMVEFFGTRMVTHNMLKDDQAIVYTEKRQVFMNPRMYARFKAVTADYRR
jgi:hypothetical protein